MSDLRHIDRIKIKKLFQMSGGYVMDFSNTTLSDFVFETVERNIYAEEYSKTGDSKAKRLRCLWNVEPNYIVAKLLSAMLDYYVKVIIPNSGWNDEKEELYRDVLLAAEALKSELSEHIETIQPNSDEKDFLKLSKAIRELIEEGKPDEAIDRLHTFLTKFLQNYCRFHCVSFDNNKPLHSLMGEYVKAIKLKGYLQSEMSERILKSSVSVLESFNKVRNDQSYAHANGLLNYEESLFIFRSVSSVVDFINAIEKSHVIEPQEKDPPTMESDLPF